MRTSTTTDSAKAALPASRSESRSAVSGRSGLLVRGEYLIERFRVVFESRSGWYCSCADFTASRECRHSREAAGMRAAQAKIAERLAAGRSELPAIARDTKPRA